MTPAEAQDILDRYTFGGLMATINPRLTLYPVRELTPDHLYVTIEVPDSSTGKRTKVVFSYPLPEWSRMNEHQFHLLVQAQLLDMWRHEFNESLRLDGELIHNPHPRGPQHGS